MARVRCRDSNSRPLVQQSPSITTRQGLPPLVMTFCVIINSIIQEQKIQTVGFTFFNVDNLAFLNDHHHNQCDQIWRFIGLWASF